MKFLFVYRNVRKYSCTLFVTDYTDLGVGIEKSEYILNEGFTLPVCVLFSGQLQLPLSVISELEDLSDLLRGSYRHNYTPNIYI